MRNKIENFRFWCHKILPLVYEDSLSYYELLCKVLKKLNEVIGQINDIDLSELYNLIKALMEIDNGGEYKFEGGTTYDPEKYYYRYDYTIYNNEMYKCNEDSVTGEFDPTKWTKTTISNEIKKNFIKTTKIMYGGFYTYYPLNPNEHMSDGLKKYYKDSVGFNNDDIEAYEYLLKDCNSFLPNSVVLGVGKGFNNAPMRNNEYEDENNYVYSYTILTFGGEPNNQQLEMFGINTAEYYSGTSVQIAIPLGVRYGTMEERVKFEPRILWRRSGTDETERTGEGGYNWENWTHHSFASFKDIEDIYRVCGVPQHLYDGRNVYQKDDYCIRMEYSDGAMKMYKALRETTGDYEDEEWRKHSFIPEDWQETNIIDELGGGTLVIREPENTFNQEVTSNLTESEGE